MDKPGSRMAAQLKGVTLRLQECSWQVLLWIGLDLSLDLGQVKEMSGSQWCKDVRDQILNGCLTPFLYVWTLITPL